jgi:DNA-directed RNA polymerase beta subunit
MPLTPVLIDAAARRAQIHAKAIDGVRQVFPLQLRNHTVEVEDVHVVPKEYSSREQKEALLKGHTLQEPLKGSLILKDAAGKVVQRKDDATLAQLPWFTPRHTFIVDGNEYAVANQRRVRPGVYTRVRGNEELEAAFNLGRGENFRISMDPAKGHLYMQYGTTNIPLYPILRRLGVPETELNKAWGRGVVEQNRAAFSPTPTKADKVVDKLYERLVPEYRRTHQTPEAKIEAIHESYRNTMLDPDVTKRTLGTPFTAVTPTALVRASKKILDVHRKGIDTDDRDSLAFQQLLGADDFLRERIVLEGRNLAKKTRLKASTGNVDLDRIIPSSPFTRTLRSFITNSSLSSIPTQINPVEIIDSATKITTLGEGGIESERAIPNEARSLHHTHFGFIDPARTPECYDEITEVFTAQGWKRWSEVTPEDQFACRIEGRLEFHPPRHLTAREYAGPLYGVKTGKIEYAVTPNHRVLCRPLDPGLHWRINRAYEVYGHPREFDTAHAPFVGIEDAPFQLPSVEYTGTKEDLHPAHGGTLRDSTLTVGSIDMRDWASFMGWYLSEGCTTFDGVQAQYCVHINQSRDANPEKYRILETLLDRLPFRWHYSSCAFHIGVKQLAAYLRKFGACQDKFIPDYLLTASIEARENLLEALLLGDGRVDSRRKTGKQYRQRVYCTTSHRLAQDVERLAISLGYPVRIRQYSDCREARYLDIYEVRLLRHRYRAARYAAQHYVMPYTGKVYCAEVPGGLLYVRRNGSVPIWSGNSFHAGVDLRAALGLKRDERGQMYTTLRNAKTGKLEDVVVHDVENATVALPKQEDRQRGISALRAGQPVSVARSEVDYILPAPELMFSLPTNTVPLPESVEGFRLLMGAKHVSQALPLVHREAPLVQVASFNPGRTMEQEIARFVVPHSPVTGTVAKIDQDYIYIRPDQKKHGAAPVHVPAEFKEQPLVTMPFPVSEHAALKQRLAHEGYAYTTRISAERNRYHPGQIVLTPWGDKLHVEQITEYGPEATHPFYRELTPAQLRQIKGHPFTLLKLTRADEEKIAAAALIKIPYDDHFPLSSKTFLHNDIKVKVGDEVEPEQLLAESNFTRDGRLALGTNLHVGYLPWYGANTNDAVVISQSASEKLTSEHMYKESMPLDTETVLDRNRHRAMFGSRWTAAQYGHLDDRGIARSGEVLQPGDPILLALHKTSPTAEQRMLGKLHRTLNVPYKETTLVWDHRCPGTVVDVVTTPQQVLVTLQTREPAAVGDKLSNRYGGKGVISQIISDDRMPHTPDGKALELLMPPTGVHGRINPAQIIETAVAKVAEKTGKPVVVGSFTGRNNVKWARNLLKENGLTDKEILDNPITGKKIRGLDGKGVMVGPQYIYKLFKSTETNYSARGVDDYDVNLQPAKGGATGAKALGRMEINALLAHNARDVLREAATIKSSRNDEFWRAYQLGLPLPPVRTSFTSEKFMEMLRGAGIKVDKSNEQIRLGPMTDADVKKLSAGAISRPLMIKEKDLSPEKDGLFDPVVTGGTAGTRWAHVDLHEPLVNPTFEDPVRRMLGVTAAQFRDLLQYEGGTGIRRRLAAIDLDRREQELRTEIREATGAQLDNALKQLKTILALKHEGLTPDKAYVISKLAVVPPVIRPILPASHGRKELLVADANYLYRDAMLANESLATAKKVLPPEEVAKARLQLYDATKAVFGLGDPVSPQLTGRGAKGFITTISGQGSPKGGFFHGKVLYRPQDVSGRGTAIPDINLNMDEIGVPEDMLWTMYGPHVIRRLVQNGYRAIDAQKAFEERQPTANDALQREIRERPLIINRAPTLHRYSMVGAYPVPVPGKTLRVNPFIEKGLNLDYDGDTLTVHVPVLPGAVKDVKSMLLSNLLFGDKTKSDLLVFPQHEAIVGLHLASSAHGGQKHRFKTKDDALAAYRRGEIALNDEVEIG